MKTKIIAVLGVVLGLALGGCGGQVVHRTVVVSRVAVPVAHEVAVVREVPLEEMIILRREPLVNRHVTRIILRGEVGSRYYDPRYCDEYDRHSPCYWKRHIK